MTDGPQPAPDWADDLDLATEEMWRRLVRGAADRRHAFHTPTIATIGLDGAPQARTMVLRAVDPPARRLRLHTDRRTDKVAELAQNPRLQVHAYDPGAKLQVRLGGVGRIEAMGAEADQAWAASHARSRTCYRVVPRPGEPAGRSGPFAHDDPDANPGRDRFCVLLIDVHRLEWLYLATPFHRRGSVDWSGSGPVRTWLVP